MSARTEAILQFSVLPAQWMSPTKQSLVRGDKCRVVDNRSGSNETIGGIAMQIFDLASQNSDISSDGEFGDAGA